MLTSNSPMLRRAPSGRRTSLLATATPAAVIASAMSRVPIEPNSLPSSPALEAIVTPSRVLTLSARASAAASYGHELTIASDEERAYYKDATAGVVTDVLAQVSSKGVDADAALAFFKAQVAVESGN